MENKRGDMVGINPEIIKKYGLSNSAWELSQYTFVNPTPNRITINPFDPQVANTFNFPTQPTGLSSPYPSVSDPRTPSVFPSEGICYDTNNQKTWIGSSGGGFISTYSDNPPQTNPSSFVTYAYPTLIGAINLAFSPTSNIICAVSAGGFFVNFIDATTGLVLATTPTGFLGQNWVTWNSVKNTFYVSTTTFIIEFSAITYALLTLLPTVAGATLQRSAFKSVTNEIFVTDDSIGADRIFVIDCTLNIVTSTIATLVIGQPFSIGYNPTSDTLYVGSILNLGIWTLNATTQVFGVDIAPTQYASDFLIHTPTNSLYVVNNSGIIGQLLRFNGTTNILEFITTFPQPSSILSLAFSPAQNIIYASSTDATTGLNSFTAIQTATLYITGSGGSSYNDDVRDFFNNPAWVKKIFIYSDSNANFFQIYNRLWKDANGKEIKYPLNAGISVSTQQFQSRIGVLDFSDNDKLILGINQWLEGLVLEPNSNYTMILAFQQIKKSDLLTNITPDGRNIDDLAESVNRINPLKKYSMNDLNRIMPLNSGEFSVQPLNISDFNQAL
ncbi:MAG: hypothetical protein LC096_05575, partial [Bacteroidia bacterium]|nr:hypothetical protein [Bacteroidia bacterium]